MDQIIEVAKVLMKTNGSVSVREILTELAKQGIMSTPNKVHAAMTEFFGEANG